MGSKKLTQRAHLTGGQPFVIGDFSSGAIGAIAAFLDGQAPARVISAWLAHRILLSNPQAAGPCNSIASLVLSIFPDAAINKIRHLDGAPAIQPKVQLKSAPIRL